MARGRGHGRKGRRERARPRPLDELRPQPVEPAGPPDSAAGQGSFTRPEDLHGPEEVPGDAHGPDLHWSPSTGVQKRVEGTPREIDDEEE